MNFEKHRDFDRESKLRELGKKAGNMPAPDTRSLKERQEHLMAKYKSKKKALSKVKK